MFRNLLKPDAVLVFKKPQRQFSAAMRWSIDVDTAAIEGLGDWKYPTQSLAIPRALPVYYEIYYEPWVPTVDAPLDCGAQ